MGIVARRGGLWDAPKREDWDKSILPDAIHSDPQAQVYLRGGNADHNVSSAASTSEVRERHQYACVGLVSFDERSHKPASFRGGKAMGTSGVGGSKLTYQLAAPAWLDNGSQAAAWRIILSMAPPTAPTNTGLGRTAQKSTPSSLSFSLSSPTQTAAQHISFLSCFRLCLRWPSCAAGIDRALVSAALAAFGSRPTLG